MSLPTSDTEIWFEEREVGELPGVLDGVIIVARDLADYPLGSVAVSITENADAECCPATAPPEPISFETENPKRQAWLTNIKVAPDARGRGIGRALVRAATRWVRDRALLLRRQNLYIGGSERLMSESTGFFRRVGFLDIYDPEDCALATDDTLRQIEEREDLNDIGVILALPLGEVLDAEAACPPPRIRVREMAELIGLGTDDDDEGEQLPDWVRRREHRFRECRPHTYLVAYESGGSRQGQLLCGVLAIAEKDGRQIALEPLSYRRGAADALLAAAVVWAVQGGHRCLVVLGLMENREYFAERGFTDARPTGTGGVVAVYYAEA